MKRLAPILLCCLGNVISIMGAEALDKPKIFRQVPVSGTSALDPNAYVRGDAYMYSAPLLRPFPDENRPPSPAKPSSEEQALDDLLGLGKKPDTASNHESTASSKVEMKKESANPFVRAFNKTKWEYMARGYSYMYSRPVQKPVDRKSVV